MPAQPSGNHSTHIQRQKVLGASLAAVAACLLLISSVPSFSGASLVFFRKTAPLYALVAVLFGTGGWWTVQTYQLLWRRGRSEWERLVFDSGVRLFGRSMAAFFVAGSAWLGWTIGPGQNDPWRWLAAVLLSGVVFGVPVALHLGYYWGSRIATLSGIERDSLVEVGDHPVT